MALEIRQATPDMDLVSSDFNVAFSMEILDYTEEALKCYTNCHVLLETTIPFVPPTYDILIETKKTAAAILLKLNRYREAYTRSQEIINILPKHTESHVLQAHVLTEVERLEAITKFNNVIELSPERNIEAEVGLLKKHITLLERGKFESNSL